MALSAGFRLETASAEDMNEAFSVMNDAYHEDEVWQLMIKGVEKKEILPWTIKTFMGRWTMPDITTYKIVEEKSGRMAGWAAIQFPWKDIPAMTGEAKDMALSTEMPPVLPGTNMEAFHSMFEMLNGAHQYGYNPEEDFHRKGTTIHPDFQKKGLGTVLTKVWNEVTDKSGDRTWCPCRPTSIKMFREHGFKDVGVIDANLERWGGSRENSLTYITLRYPPGKEPETNGANAS